MYRRLCDLRACLCPRILNIISMRLAALLVFISSLIIVFITGFLYGRQPLTRAVADPPTIVPKRHYAVCTSSSLNHLDRVKTFFRYLKVSNPSLGAISIFWLVVDRRNESLVSDLSGLVTIVWVEDLGSSFGSVIKEMLFQYNQVESNSAFRGAFLLYLFEKYAKFDSIMYLDADIAVYHSLDLIADLLEDHDAVLTPHSLEPFPNDGHLPSALHLLNVGTINAGFFAIKRSVAATRYLLWFHSVLIAHCIVAMDRGIFLDQKWMDMAVSWMDVKVLRDKAVHVAYWNLHERGKHISQLNTTLGVVYTDPETNLSRPVIFIHYSGLVLDDWNSITRPEYSKRYSLDKDFPNLLSIWNEYRRTYLEITQTTFTAALNASYSFDFYNNGTKIHKWTRLFYRYAPARIRKSLGDDPFDGQILELDSYQEFFENKRRGYI